MADDGSYAGVVGCGIVHNHSFSDPRGSLSVWDDVVPFSMTRINFVYVMCQKQLCVASTHTPSFTSYACAQSAG